jgi:hypothetical protein
MRSRPEGRPTVSVLWVVAEPTGGRLFRLGRVSITDPPT